MVSKDFLEKRTTLTYGYDVAKGIASIIGQNDALSNVFHITNNRSYTWKELLDCYIEAIEEKTGIKPKYTVIEKWQKYLGGGAEQVKYDRVYNRVFDNTKIAKYIDINQFQDTKQALKECVYAFIDSQKWGCISPASELKKDKLTGDKTPLPIIKLKLRTRVKLFLVKHNII